MIGVRAPNKLTFRHYITGEQPGCRRRKFCRSTGVSENDVLEIPL